MVKMRPLTTLAVTGLMVAGLTTAAWAASPKMKMTTDIPKAFTAWSRACSSTSATSVFPLPWR